MTSSATCMYVCKITKIANYITNIQSLIKTDDTNIE